MQESESSRDKSNDTVLSCISSWLIVPINSVNQNAYQDYFIWTMMDSTGNSLSWYSIVIFDEKRYALANKKARVEHAHNLEPEWNKAMKINKKIH